MNVPGRSLGPVMLDVVGLTLDDNDVRRIAHPLTGGVILFARNFERRTQLASLIRQIRTVREDILIAVDHEGGRVQRFKTDGFTHLPAMREIGAIWDRDQQQALRIATATGYVLASELRALGIDFSFTPALDVDYGVSEVIGTRAFHRDVEVITQLAKSLCHGLALVGMANCGKHFPGHGFVEADSHYTLPVDSRSREAILRDARPFAWLDIALAAVMPAHVIYSSVDDQPAGFSKAWVQDILREELGFLGAIISDDLTMEGARAVGNVVESAQAAFTAGCDMVLVCNKPEEADRLLNELNYTPSSASIQRITRLAARGSAPTWEELEQVAEYQAARALLAKTFG